VLQLTRRELDSDIKNGVLFPPTSEFRLSVDASGTVAWRRLDGSLTNTGTFRFIIDQNKTIFASDMKDESETNSPTFPRRPRFHHASLVGSTWPKYAGRGFAGKGWVVILNNHTGHFAQPKSTFDQVFDVFQDAGVDVQRARAAWFEGVIYFNFDPNRVMARMAPLRSHPEGATYGIYEDSDPVRSDLSPNQYRSRILGL
jgi:hypothetical protein